MRTPTFDEDGLNWLLTPTALYRRYAPPVFLPPHQWPKGVWDPCNRNLHR